MNTKSLKWLRIGALVMGWLLMVGVLADIWSQYAIYYRSQNNPMGLLKYMAPFNIAGALSSFFAGFGNAFFAFLIAAVLRMIEKQAPIEHEQTNRLMIVCCLSYAADALVRIGSWILNPVTTSPFMRGFDWLVPYSSTAIPILAPILYAASIFVLYTHFTNMVTFESEVA